MNAVILCCTTLLEYVKSAQKARGTDFPVVEIDRKYHDEPAKMKENIIKTIESLPAGVDTVLVAMGLCGNSWNGVSCSKTVVIPKVADCVALMLATPERFSPDLKEAGHMYVFGDGRNGFSIRSIHESLLEQYDEETADEVFEMYFENYKFVDIIETGVDDCRAADYVARAQADADSINSELRFVKGSNILLEELVGGDRNGKFLVFPPNTVIKQEDFM